MSVRLRLAHLSDTHLGFRQFDARTRTGRNLREQDNLRAFAGVVDDITTTDVDVVIHAGDVYDAPIVRLSHQKLFQSALEKLTRRADGTIRPVIVISGNHDQPSDPREPAAIELNTPIPGAHIVSGPYTIIDLGSEYDDPALTDVVVHAIPHDQLRVIDWETVLPLPGKINILTSHGVVGGSDLYKRTKGREYAIPVEVLTRGWAYVAMGHWHKRGPVPVGSHTRQTTPVWYAGSPENNDWAEAAGPQGTDGRGWLEVHLADDQSRRIIGHDLPIRPMYTLPVIDANGLDAAEVEQQAINAISGAEFTDAVVRQQVAHITTDEWRLLNFDTIRKAAQHTTFYDLFRLPTETLNTTEGLEKATYTDLTDALEAAIGELFAEDDDSAAVLELATRLLSEALAEPGEVT